MIMLTLLEKAIVILFTLLRKTIVSILVLGVIIATTSFVDHWTEASPDSLRLMFVMAVVSAVFSLQQLVVKNTSRNAEKPTVEKFGIFYLFFFFYAVFLMPSSLPVTPFIAVIIGFMMGVGVIAGLLSFKWYLTEFIMRPLLKKMRKGRENG